MTTLSLLPIVGSALSTYNQNKAIRENKNEMDKFKRRMDLSPILLKNEEFELIKIFINKSIETNKTISNTIFTHIELMDILNIDNDKLVDILNGIDSDFVKKERIMSNDRYSYSLNYDTFIKSNLIELCLDNPSFGYSDVLFIVVKYMKDNFHSDERIDVENMLNNVMLNDIFLNPVLFHLDSLGVIKLSSELGQVNKSNLISYSFTVDISQLKKFIRMHSIEF